MNFPVRMAHPQHGFMHAYSPDEIERLKGLGWAPEVKEEARKKRGPKPKVSA